MGSGDGWVLLPPSFRPKGHSACTSGLTDWLFSHMLIVLRDRPVKYVGEPGYRWKSRVQPIVEPVGGCAPKYEYAVARYQLTSLS